MYSDFKIKEFTQQLQNFCSKAQSKKVLKNNTITTYIKNRNQFCILKKGQADIIRYDVNGNKTIIETLKEQDIFGELFFPIRNSNEIFVVAKTDCEVIFFLYEDIAKKCNKSCKFHEELNSILLSLLTNKIITQNIRIKLLTKRSIRGKLQSYFDSLSKSLSSNTFLIPMSYTDLADYLSVDRSAMMRELKSLHEDGYIIKNGNKITLNKEQKS